ncbi:MAG: hypothetical protein RBT49_02300 [Bacteroidales bacterium]|jgi:hypothetical protein|nr:hypothetical protein [Bacteroidales bacterium]
MQLLKETFSEVLTESVLDESTNTKNWFVEGITLQSEVKNGNGRIYPMPVLEKAISIHVDKYLNNKRAVGELDHPENNAASIKPENISHVFESVIKEGNNFRTRARLLNTPKGRIGQNLLEAGITLGISSRGLGSIKESNGAKVVQELQLVSLGDLVFEPSAPDAFLTAIQENCEWVYDNGVLVKKDLSEEIDKYKKTIQEAKAKDIQNVVKKIFSDYINKLK